MKDEFSYEIRQHIGYLLEICSGRANTVLMHRLKEFNLTTHGYYVLLFGLSQQVTQRQVVQKLCLNVNTVTRLVDTLEHLRYAKRSVNPINRKENFVQITALGEKVAKQALAKMTAVRSDAYRDITKDECQELRRILLKLLDAGGPRL